MKSYRREKDWTTEQVSVLRRLLLAGFNYKEISTHLNRSVLSLQHAKSRYLKDLPRQNQGMCQGAKCHNYKRGFYRDSSGYLVESKSGRRIHRIVMEKFLNRRLEAIELVHHKNGDKEDNRRENLILTTRSEHRAKYHPEIGIDQRFGQ